MRLSLSRNEAVELSIAASSSLDEIASSGQTKDDDKRVERLTSAIAKLRRAVRANPSN